MEILDALLYMLNQMSPYILLGFFIAGLLHAFVPERLMSRHLAGTGWKSVVKAAAIGVPLPLCSCGVLPTAVALRKAGASKAATTSFLIATPQTGVDSIAATYSLLGPAFAVMRPVAALVTAVAGGVVMGKKEKAEAVEETCTADEPDSRPKTLKGKIWNTFKYGYFDLLQSIGKWLVIGLVVAALITVLVPDDFFLATRRWPFIAMIAAVVIAIPMYVCATGSIPIALSLMLKGLSPGTAFVLLMAGPAANFASITVISRAMGKRSAMLYLGSIIVGAIAFGLAIDYLLPFRWFDVAQSGAHHAGHCCFSLFDTICSVILVALLIIALVNRYLIHHKPTNTTMSKEYKIKGMMCAHCQATVEKGLGKLEGVTSVTVDLGKGTATLEGNPDDALVRKTIEDLGFENG